MTDETASRSRVLPPKLDSWIAAGLSLLILSGAALQFGVWEPWEANVSTVAQNMVESGRWLEVNTSADAQKGQTIAELPFGYWPVAASTSLLGVNTLSIRLPGVVFGAGTIFVLMLLMSRLASRTVAWWSSLVLLCIPLFSFNHWLALGQSTTMMSVAIACLAFIQGRLQLSSRWFLLGWLFATIAGLSGGVPALCAPLAVFLLSSIDEQKPTRPAGVVWVAAIIALSIVGFGWWRASIYMPSGSAIETLLLWADNIHVTSGTSRPGFNDFVHQIGFGLFPFGALLPFALMGLLWSDSEQDRLLGSSLFIWIVAAFAGPALGASYSHFGLFLGAPAAALAVTIYLARMPKLDASPVLAILSVIMLALLDSNLKHETRLLADTIVGTSIDSFPAALPYWRIARLLNFGLVAYILLYQGRVHHWLNWAVRYFGYPVARRPFFDVTVAGLASIVPILLLQKRTTLEPYIHGKFWGNAQDWFRRLLIALLCGLCAYVLIWTITYVRSVMVRNRDEGKLSAVSNWVSATIDGRSAYALSLAGRTGATTASVILSTLLLSWVGFMNVPVARELSTNFSQKNVLNVYRQLAQGDEKLYTYRVAGQSNSFYSRDLPVLKTAKEFKALAKADARFFVLIPRKDLASVNLDFRRSTGRTLPVIDDSGSRYYLASNKLDEGSVDKNPITNALIEELPKDANKVSINFEDKIELVGWKVDPVSPKSGSPAKLHMFWRAKAKTQSTWKIFVHIDAPGQRIHGDHDPVAGLFPTRNWKQGDLIQDIHEINIKRTITPARFTFYAGLYRGSTRMKIKSGAKDKQNRARLGTIQVR
ncbi:MAG: glycosyltransferase family 39 protein [Bradymonadia bacterium]